MKIHSGVHMQFKMGKNIGKYEYSAEFTKRCKCYLFDAGCTISNKISSRNLFNLIRASHFIFSKEWPYLLKIFQRIFFTPIQRF